MGKPNVLLIGHSFVRRYRDTLIKPENGRKSGRDISESRGHVAITAARVANVSYRVGALFTASQKINLLKHLDKSETTVIAVQPEVVVLHIGSNDLANFPVVDEFAARELAKAAWRFAEHLCNDYGVRRVVMLSTLPRAALITGSPATFTDNMNFFNSELENLCRPLQQLIYVRVRGFFFKKVNNLDVPRPVAEWSTDGVHCDEESMPKYAKRIRLAILNATSH